MSEEIFQCVLVTVVFALACVVAWIVEKEHDLKELEKMKTSLLETMGEAIAHVAQEKQYKNDHPEAVGFLKVHTIKGMLGVVEQIYRLLDHDSVELSEGVTLKVGQKLKVTMERNDHVEFSFSPAPRVRAKVVGMVNVNAGLEGIKLYRNELKLILDGLPDVRIGLE